MAYNQRSNITKLFLRGLQICCLLVIGLTSVASAQLLNGFGESAEASPQVARPAQKNPPAQRPTVASNPTPAAVMEKSQQINPNEVAPKELEPQAAYQFRFVGDKVEMETKPKIFLYLRDFKISRNLNGSANCSMRFFVLSTMKEKINNISYRLKWQGMETALSFDDVEPNVANYFDYSLLGKGCYNMDKAPNIIVNRCRVRGFSQQQCADAIQWLN